MPDPKKPWEKNYTATDASSGKKPWEQNLVTDEVKKKAPSTSIVQKKELVLEPTTGSSGGQNTEMKKFTGLSGADLKSLESAEKPVPKINKSIQKQFNDVDEVANRKEYQQKAIQKYRTKTKLSDEEKEETRKDLIAKENQEGIWNNIKAVSKNVVNKASDLIFRMTDEGSAPEDLKVDTDPFSDEKKQARDFFTSEGIKNPKKTDIDAKAKEIYVDNVNLEKKQQKINSYLKDVSPETKSLLKIDANERFQSLSKEKKDATNRININQKYFDELSDALEDPNITEKDRIELSNERIKIAKYIDSDYKSFSKKDQELGTAQDEFEAFKRNYNAFDNFASRAGHSLADAAISFYSGANYVANMLGAKEEYKQEDVQKGKEYIQQERERFRPENKDITFDNFFQYSTDLLANQTGTLAQIGAGGIGGVAALGVEGSGDTYSQMQLDQKNGKTYTPTQMAIAPFVSGLSTAILSELPTVSTLKNSANVWLSAMKGEAGRKLINSAVKNTSEGIIKNIVKETGKEVATESMDNIVQNAIRRDILGDKNVGYFDNTLKTIKDTALLTGMIGGVGAMPHVAMSAVKTFSDKETAKQLDINAKKINTLLGQLDNKDISETTKKVMKEQIEIATKQNSDSVNKTIDKIGEMPINQIETVYNNSKRIYALQQEAIDIKGDSGLDDTAKQTLLNGLEQEYKSLEDTNTKIINTEQKSELATSPLKKELVRIKAPEKLIEAINDNVELKRPFIINTGKILEDILTGGMYSYDGSDTALENPKESIEISEVTNFFNKARKDKTLLHEAVHAATSLIYSEMDESIENKNYTKKQKDSFLNLNSIIDNYIDNTSSLAKETQKLYGLTNHHEFLAEFISNPKFRNYIGKTDENKKVSTVNYIWNEILDLLGINKSKINEEKLSNISNYIDDIFDATKEYNNNRKEYLEQKKQKNEIKSEATSTGATETKSQTEVQEPANETKEKEIGQKGVLDKNTYTLKDGEKFDIKIFDGINGEVKSFDDRKNKDRLSFSVHNDKGESIANITFWQDTDGKFYSNNTNVNKNYQRKGIATAVYNYAEQLGIDIKPSATQTKMGESFYNTREKRKSDPNYAPENIIKDETFDYKTGESTVELEDKPKKNEGKEDSNIASNGNNGSGAKPVDEVRTTEQEDTVEEPVSKTTKPDPSERKVEVEKEFKRSPGKRTLLNRLIEGGNGKEITDSLNNLRKDYDIRNQKQADSFAKAFIEKVGIAEALNSTKEGLIENNDIKFLVYSEGLNQLKNEIDKEDNLKDRDALIKEFQSLSDSFDNDARNAGQGLSILNYIYNKDQSLKYSLSKLISDYKANDINGEIPAEVKAEFEKLTNQLKDVEERIKDAEKRADKAEEELAIKNIQEDIARKKTTKKTNTAEAKDLANKIRQVKIHKPGIFSSATPASLVWDGAIEIVAKSVEKGGAIADAIQKGLEHIKNSEWYKSLSKSDKEEAESTFKSSINESQENKNASKITIDDEGKIKIPAQVFRDYVEAGETDIDVIAKKIKEDLSEEYPDVDVREIRDALTGYGKQINPNKDEITAKINRLKEYGRLLSAYEDVSEGQMPKKSGLKREKPEQRSRELRAKINRLAKELGIESVNLEEQWATAIDKIKSNLKNQIEDLDRQIEKGEKRKIDRTETKLDFEAEILKSIRDEKKKILDDLVGKPELTEEEKIEKAESVLEKSIAKLQEEIDTQNIAYKEKPSVLNSAKLENLRTQKKGLIATKHLLREEAGLIEQKRLKTAKTRVKKQIEDLEERIKNKDFAKKEVKPLLADDELNKLRAEKEEIYEYFEKLKYIQELKNRSKARKFADAALESLGLLRAIKASLDLGLIGIQLRGFTYSEMIRNPKELGRKFWKLFGAIGSQKKADKAMSVLVGHPLFGLAKKLDIGITQPDLRNEVREEMASGNLLKLIWNSPFIISKKLGAGKFTDEKKKALGDTIIDGFKKEYNKYAKNKVEITDKEKFSRAEQFKNANAFEAVERGLSAFGNQLRFEEFIRGVDRLKAEGKDPINHEEDYKALASYIRTFSGRAKPAGLEMNQKALNVFFFSFKNAASVFQQLNPVWYAYQQYRSSDFKAGNYTKVSVANKMAMATMLKSVASTAATILFIMAAYNAFKDEDDEEMTIETDSTSSDFGKIRKGNFRYDPWGGYVPLITLYARLYSEEVKKSDGTKYKFGENRFGIESRGDATSRFLFNKESPGFQAFHHYMTSKEEIDETTGETVRVNKFGEKLSEDQAFSLYPIFLGSVKENLKEEPDAVKDFLTAYSVLGLGNVQNYKSGGSGGSGKKEKGSGPKLPSPPKPPTPN
ncbi:MAG: hypothetical protein V4666_08355 [Bacteroidota bacterium]